MRRIRAKFFASLKSCEEEVLLENRLSTGEYFGYTSNYIQVAAKIDEAGLKNSLVKVSLRGAFGSAPILADFEGFVFKNIALNCHV